MSGVYYRPEEHGLELVGEVQWGEACYDFDLTAVWRDPLSGQLYYADDSGCSCPAPFEDFLTRESLTAASRQDVLAHLTARAAIDADYIRDAASLIERVSLL